MDLVSWTLGGHVSDPDQPLLIDALSPSNSLSFRELFTKVRQLIAGLRTVGVQPGDSVCVNCFNDLHYSVLYLGIIGAGAVFTGVNPSFTPNELRHHFDLTKPKLLIAEPPMLAKTLVAAQQAGLSAQQLYVLDTEDANPNPDLPSWTALLQHGECGWVSVQTPDTTVATYNSTSGTSGLPKAAMVSHSYHVTQAAFHCDTAAYPRSRLLTLPPFHAFGSPVLPSSIRQNIPTYIMRRYAEAPFLDSIQKYRISETYVAPPVLMSLPKSALATREGLDSLRSIWMGGASVKFAQQQPLYDLLHEDACIRSVWGMTEAGWITCVQDRTRRLDDSVGQTLNGFEVRIVDEDGEVVTTDNVSGELLIRVPHPLLSYISNPSATEEAFTPCRTYLRSGDIGYRTTDPTTGAASVFIIDRAKELIKVRGWQVSPAEVESELLQHPGVADAAVIGVKEANGVEEFIRAYIVCKASPSSSEEDVNLLDKDSLRTWLRGRLAGYKVPVEYSFVAAVPRNGTGKILRRVLRDGQKKAPVHRRVDSVMSNTEVVGGTPAAISVKSSTAVLPDIKAETPLPQAEPGVGTQKEVRADVSDTPFRMRRKLKKLLCSNKVFSGVAVAWASSLKVARQGFNGC